MLTLKKGMLLVTSDNDVATKVHLENLMLEIAGQKNCLVSK